MAEIRFRSDVSVTLVQSVGDDAGVCRAARVSTLGTAAAGTAEASGLLRYLMKHRHGTPFEHGLMTFLVEAPIFVFREWHRHRVGWSYSETSGRYRELEPVFWVPPAGRKMIPVPGYKAARPQFEEAGGETLDWVRGACQLAYGEAWVNYRAMVDDGIALEVARCVLPVGLYSSMYATANPRSLMHFLSLRTHEPDAARVSYPQAEIEECARLMEAEFARLYPLTHAAFCEFGRQAP
jgi:thymidylate synthase (FAD)